MLITLEGVEGSGKSSQMTRLIKNMQHLPLVVSREPGGTPLGKEIRSLLLTSHSSGEVWCSMAELLLFYADRAQHVETLVKPALATGKHVLLDRFNDSTWAYQGARGVPDELLLQLAQLVLGDFKPDLTIILDIDPVDSLKRVAIRNNKPGEVFTETRFDNEVLEFHLKVRQRFLRLATREPSRVALIDATGTPDEVEAAIWQRVSSFLEGKP